MIKEKYGLAEAVLCRLISVFKKEKSIQKAILFGSRAMGNYKKGSDIDIAIIGNISIEDRNRIFVELNEHTTIPHKIDIVLYNEQLSPELKQHIDEYGLELWNVEC